MLPLRRPPETPSALCGQEGIAERLPAEKAAAGMGGLSGGGTIGDSITNAEAIAKGHGRFMVAGVA